ncbi:hypothetical protein [Kluyvera ascorbata]|uniref:hypothetical protein n=1 Tax=Kluyvera ascorbata TaxID=51288 RepID=UPI000E05B02D|nr:hypothetical protein [Kluyvera ascorbata]STW99500.1 Uncharacterised protein [Kluyvera ascorbata]STX01611.1 Uncharacterised protein [Kluyvera ascorbata]
MSLTLLASNNASTVLASSINASATTLTVNTGAGSLFPSPVSGTSFFKLTLVDAATGQLTEIVHVTARAGDVMTIERAQEGTAARVWSANDIAANMMTAGTLSYILGSFQPLDATLTALAGLTGSADKLAYFNGDDTAALTALTGVGRDIIGKTTIADVLSYLGLGDLPTFGDAASKNVGTTAGTVAAGDDSRIVNAVQASNPGLCTAWVNFNGVGGATIRTSNNVSSVTRLSTGRYQITFTTPMSSANYVAMLTIGDGGGTGTAAPVVMLSGSVITGEPIKDANSITIGVRGNAQAAYDASEINAAFFGGK